MMKDNRTIDKKQKRKKVDSLSILTASAFLVYVSLFISGFRRNMNTVPYWDEWDTRVDLLTLYNSDGLSAIFSLHNEHRSVFSSGLFILDALYFNGNGYIIYFFNFLILVSISLCIYLILLRIGFADIKFRKFYLIVLVLTPYISLTGSENIYWANQNVFFLATLFPLLTFAVFFLDEKNSHTIWVNSVATMLGALSTLSMASGLAVPFFLSLAFLFVFRNYFFALSNFIIGVIIYYFYQRGMNSTTNSNPFRSLVEDPISIVIYTFKYLSSPMFVGTNQNRVLSNAYGLFLVATLLYCFYSTIRKSEVKLNLILILVIYFVSVASITGMGRVQFGSDQAYSSRYTIIAWTIAILTFALRLQLVDRGKRKRLDQYKPIAITVISMIVLTFPYQISASKIDLEEKTKKVFSQQLLLFGLGDTIIQQAIYPDYKRLLEVSNPYWKASTFNFSSDIFLKSLNVESDSQKRSDCISSIDNIRALDSNSSFSIVAGWFNDVSIKGTWIKPTRLEVVDMQNRIVGVGFIGLKRLDVSKALSVSNNNLGFQLVVQGQSLNGLKSLQTSTCASLIMAGS
jgi:hypothetical protein